LIAARGCVPPYRLHIRDDLKAAELMSRITVLFKNVQMQGARKT
jgi:hypothetical protein